MSTATILSGAGGPDTKVVKLFGYDIGIALQIIDNIIDFTSD
jgi:geranylgeranyl pyrophosphate synthase